MDRYFSSKEIIFTDNQVSVDCGAMLGTFVKKINSNNITGFESLGGVPGTVGGALIMNAGAHGMTISGSGPTVFAVCDDADKAEAIREWLQANYVQNEDGFSHVCRIPEKGAVEQQVKE